MQFLILIYDNESQAPETPTDPAAFAEYMAPWEKYTNELVEAGVMRGGEALHPTPTARTVSIRDGEQTVTDGPFAETVEQLGGFYLIECETMDEAVKWGAACPAAHSGRIEVRQIMDLSGAP